MKASALFLSALLFLTTLPVSAQLVSPLEGREGVGLPTPPSPALTSCLNSGGKIESYTAQSGYMSLCKIGQSLIGDWTLHYQLSNDDQYAVEIFLKHPAPGKWRGANPAAEYCADLGGMSVIIESAGGQSGVCEFADRSQIEQWTLFRGPQDVGNADLVRVLTATK